jgi:uncharacterized radical SAM superfamily Fe-S cluster-containing enzyme
MKQVIPSMEEAKAKVVARALEARQRADGRPFLIGHFITNRCPCKCASCLWLHNDWEDVPLEDLKRFYSEAREEGFIGTAITGGEPFIRKDLGQIVRFMKEEAGMHILLFNTGWYLKERMDEPRFSAAGEARRDPRPARHLRPPDRSGRSREDPLSRDLVSVQLLRAEGHWGRDR